MPKDFNVWKENDNNNNKRIKYHEMYWTTIAEKNVPKTLK